MHGSNLRRAAATLAHRRWSQRQRSFDFGPRALSIPLAPRPKAGFPTYAEMSRFVRSVRSAGVEPLQQLLAMVQFAICDHQRLQEPLPEANTAPLMVHTPEPVVITDQDIPL